MLRLPTENDTRKVVSLSPILVTWQSTQGRKECHEKGQNKNIFPKAMPRIVPGLKFRPLSRQASRLGMPQKGQNKNIFPKATPRIVSGLKLDPCQGKHHV